MNHLERRSIDKSGLSEKEITMLREQFISSYANEKGWVRESLSTEQLLEIKEQRGYKTPGIILG